MPIDIYKESKPNMAKNELHNLKIEKPVFGGLGLGYSHGRVIMVQNAVPGDIIDVEITTDKPDYALARISNIISPSEYRISPDCPVFDTCGGCSYLNVPYEIELKLKKEIFADNLKRIGSFQSDEIPSIEMIFSERYHYRSHGRVQVENNRAGFFARDTNNHVPLPEQGCLLLNRKLNDLLKSCSFSDGEIQIAVDYAGNTHSTEDKDQDLYEQVGDIIYLRSLKTFFQANQLLRKKMIDTVISNGKFTKSDSLIDIGCGCGFFTIPCAGHVNNVHGFDILKESISYAEKNAQGNNCTNCSFSAKKDSELHPVKDRENILLCDPPRAGLSKKSRQTILAIKPERIIYVSCNPATYSRDIKHFCSQGYSLKKLVLLDMFPCTHHLEIVSTLEWS